MNNFTESKYRKIQSHFNQLRGVRNKNEVLFINGHLTIKDISQLYRGLFLDAYISFESFLEDMFIGLLHKDNCVGYVARPVFPVNSTRMGRRLLFSKDKYLDWLPYEKTEEISKIFFKKNKNPFIDPNRVDSSDKYFMNKELPIVRNILSHNSEFAYKKFNRLLDDKYPFLSIQERKPVNFIRYLYSRSLDITILEKYLNNILMIAYKIAN